MQCEQLPHEAAGSRVLGYPLFLRRLVSLFPLPPARGVEEVAVCLTHWEALLAGSTGVISLGVVGCLRLLVERVTGGVSRSLLHGCQRRSEYSRVHDHVSRAGSRNAALCAGAETFDGSVGISGARARLWGVRPGRFAGPRVIGTLLSTRPGSPHGHARDGRSSRNHRGGRSG